MLRQRKKARAFCLSVRGRTRFLIEQPLTGRAANGFLRAFVILDAKSGTIVMAEVEFRKIAVQMGFADMVKGTNHAALKIEK
jgi:hypothetical protein